MHRNGIAMGTHRFSLRKKRPEEWRRIIEIIRNNCMCNVYIISIKGMYKNSPSLKAFLKEVEKLNDEGYEVYVEY